MTKEQAVEAFKPIDAQADVIDPGAELDWYSLAVGFFLGKGESPENAHELAMHIRYHTDLG